MPPLAPRIPLCVPSWDEAHAFDCGARYDATHGWTAPNDAYLASLWKWLPRKFDPDAPRPVLMPDMLPVTTWEQNIRFKLGTDAWDRMRRHAYRAAGFRCEICGAKGRLEAHEWFELENETTTQRLKRIIALCPLCHAAHHVGLAQRRGVLPDVRRHLRDVNGWSESELNHAMSEAYEVWQQRCEWPWHVDLSWLHASGYVYV